MIATLLTHCGNNYLVHYTGGVVVHVYAVHQRLPLSIKLRLKNADGKLRVKATPNDRDGWFFERQQD